MKSFQNRLSTSNSFFLLAGPCAIEGEEMAMRIAEHMVKITEQLGIPFVFKGSFKKANRSRLDSFIGIGDEKALKILRSRLYEYERKKLEDERSKDRKSKIGTGDRSERIRTYNFPQGRVTDHRINLTLHKLEEFMQGEIFDEVIENLNLQAQEEQLENLK